jgi:hypothetical protein
LSNKLDGETFGVPNFATTCRGSGQDCWRKHPITIQTFIDQDFDELGRTVFRFNEKQSAGLGVITAKMSADIRAGKIDIIVVYKVDRLTRSLADFAKLVELFDAQAVSFVSVTQQFNTTSSMGRLTLNVLLSFAQFEREVTGERIRDKIAASGL